MNENQPKQVQIPLVWEDTEHIPTVYANNLLITHAGGAEFYLIFGEVVPPILLGTPGEKLPKKINIKPVAKIVLTPEAMIKFSEIINLSLKSLLSTVQVSEKKEE